MQVGKRILQVIAGAVLAGGMLSASPPPAAAATKCPLVEMPVCAVGPTGERKRYTNTCFARAAHARVLHAGDCVAPDGNNICMMIYMPVCAISPVTRKRTTYSNLCASEVANARLVSEGACPGAQPMTSGGGDMCIQIISCGTKNGKRKEYPTPCAATADGATDVTPKVGPSCAVMQ